MISLSYNALLFSAVLLSLTITGCKDDIVYGCTDETADNFNFDANQDDGSCTYSGQITFWYNNETRDSLIANDIESVIPMIGDEYATTIYPDFVLFSAEPECETSSIGRIRVSLGTEKTDMIHFRVAINDVNDIRWQDSTVVSQDGCELYQMVW